MFMVLLINRTAGALMALTLPSVAAAEQRVVCTLAVDVVSGDTVMQEGSCDARMSPASTFKIPISLMAFDSGVFIGPDEPRLSFKDGYADWNPDWRQDTSPASWMRDSVVWFSQRATEQIGQDQFKAYVDAFDYGNRDVSGDEDKANGLITSWLSSSLQISPTEKVTFLTRMIEGKLPVKSGAVEQTKQLLEFDGQPEGWRVFGKTGGGFPFAEDGTLMRGQPFGWYVGWAEKKGRTVVFARLIRFSERPGKPSGTLAREGLVSSLFVSGGPLERY